MLTLFAARYPSAICNESSISWLITIRDLTAACLGLDDHGFSFWTHGRYSIGDEGGEDWRKNSRFDSGATDS